MRHYNVDFHLFADDTQLYLSFDISEIQSTCHQMECCIADISSWMTSNFLKLNSEKTEMLLISSRFNKADTSSCSLNIAGTTIKTSSVVRNIGAVFDSCLSLESHVNQVCRSSYLHLRNLGAIRKYLTPSTAACAVHAFITSKLDCLNGLLLHLPDRLLNKLQRIQNTAARIVSLTKKTDHITPVLASLHWLPVRARIDFKVCLIVFRVLHGQAPAYLVDIFKLKATPRQLRSSSDHFLLAVPRVKTVSYGDRAFSVGAAVLWNSLPSDIRNLPKETVFRKCLKTYLFRKYFN